MARTPQIRPVLTTAHAAHPSCSLSPLIPLQAVWASLTLSQQQRLFHQLVAVCCGLLRPHPEGRGKETPNDAP
jgi:hypothetical protein